LAVTIAEYLGQRTDASSSDIIPSIRGGSNVPTCPFSGGACIKLAHNPPLQPVCTVRIDDKTAKGRAFIVCSNRLIPAQAVNITPAHTAALASIAQTVFPGVANKDIGYRRQVGLNLNPGSLILDYILHVDPIAAYARGPERVFLEVQGGGETNNTGTITRYIDDWNNQTPPTNAFLSQPLNTKNLRAHLNIKKGKVNVPGIIPNNAWKRQLDQILKKAIIANHFGGAFALVCGDVLYDYIRRSIPVGGAFFQQWEVALIGVSEVPASLPITPGAPLALTHVTKSVFMTFADFIAALQGFQVPASLNDPFKGSFDTLTNQKFTVP
jgi:hypothetical protein